MAISMAEVLSLPWPERRERAVRTRARSVRFPRIQAGRNGGPHARGIPVHAGVMMMPRGRRARETGRNLLLGDFSPSPRATARFPLLMAFFESRHGIICAAPAGSQKLPERCRSHAHQHLESPLCGDRVAFRSPIRRRVPDKFIPILPAKATPRQGARKDGDAQDVDLNRCIRRAQRADDHRCQTTAQVISTIVTNLSRLNDLTRLKSHE